MRVMKLYYEVCIGLFSKYPPPNLRAPESCLVYIWVIKRIECRVYMGGTYFLHNRV